MAPQTKGPQQREARAQVRLFHVSEEPGIEVFKPRWLAHRPELEPAVWAVDEARLRNYLLPRECPRVTFYAWIKSSDRDVETYLDGRREKIVVAVERAWLERIEQTTLTLYEMPPEGFDLHDECAGHYRSTNTVHPLRRHTRKDLPERVRECGAEFRPVQTLWPLFDQIVPSTLPFSMIRMRNAQARKPNDET